MHIRYLANPLWIFLHRWGTAGGDRRFVADVIVNLALYIDALTFAGLLSPGAPLCKGHSGDPVVDGLELVLKGGQVGPENFFEMVRKGK